MPQFTPEELQDLKDFSIITLNNGLIQDPNTGLDVPRTPTPDPQNYAYGVMVGNRFAPQEQHIDVPNCANQRLWLKPVVSKTWELRLGQTITSMINRPLKDFLEKRIEGNELVPGTQTPSGGIIGISSSKEDKQSIAPREAGSLLKNKFTRVVPHAKLSLQYGPKLDDQISLYGFIYICPLAYNFRPSTFLGSIPDDITSDTFMKFDFNNIQDPTQDRKFTTRLNFKDRLNVVFEIDKINIANQQVTKLKKHLSTSVLSIDTDKELFEITLPPLDLDVNGLNYQIELDKYLATFPDLIEPPTPVNPTPMWQRGSTARARLRTRIIRNFTTKWVRDNMQAIVAKRTESVFKSLEGTNFSIPNMLTPLNRTAQRENPNLTPLERDIKSKAIELQNIIDRIHNHKDIKIGPDCCKLEGFIYRVTNIRYNYDIYLENMLLKWRSTDDTTDIYSTLISFDHMLPVYKDDDGFLFTDSYSKPMSESNDGEGEEITYGYSDDLSNQVYNGYLETESNVMINIVQILSANGQSLFSSNNDDIGLAKKIGAQSITTGSREFNYRPTISSWEIFTPVANQNSDDTGAPGLNYNIDTYGPGVTITRTTNEIVSVYGLATNDLQVDDLIDLEYKNGKDGKPSTCLKPKIIINTRNIFEKTEKLIEIKE